MEQPTYALKEEARDIFYEYPILEFIGFLVVAYFGLFFITFYVGPALFGTRPYRPFLYHRKKRSASNQPQSDDLGLVSAVTNSIENFINNY